MIDLFYWPTPNGWKVTLLLEELGLPYRVHPVNIGQDDQFRPEFLAVGPNNRMPVIIDQAPPDGGPALSLFESGAILKYLAQTHGRFYGQTLRDQARIDPWLFWQHGGLGPMAGQTHHFNRAAPEPVPYAIARYTAETRRLYGVLNTRLAGRDWVAGEYSIADMAIWPWIRRHDWQGIALEEFPEVQRWYDALAARPAAQRAVAVGADWRDRNVRLEEEDLAVLTAFSVLS